MSELKYDSLEDTLLPEHIIEKLVEAGLDTPEKILEAEDQEFLAIAGIGRHHMARIRHEVRTPLDRALDPFRRVAKLYFDSFRTDYPLGSLVLNMQHEIIRVGDFVELHEALKELDQEEKDE